MNPSRSLRRKRAFPESPKSQRKEKIAQRRRGAEEEGVIRSLRWRFVIFAIADV
jgi:hypothetical protein